MYRDTYKRIEREYEQKRNIANQKYRELKEAIYASTPRLREIDVEIAKLGIKSAKLSISTANDKEQIAHELKAQIDSLKAEKEAILKQLNIELRPQYSCEKCQDTGFYVENGTTHMCPCFKQELINESYSKSNLYKLKEESFDKIDMNLFSDVACPEKYKTNISPRDNMKKIIEFSRIFIENFNSPKQKNLLFTGTPGVGKTFMSSCIANEIINKNYTVLYQTSSLLLNSVFEYKFSKDESSKELYNSLFNVNLLVIDDLGTENLTAAKFEELFTIINSRLITQYTKTIISTNLSLEELAQTYDHRIISRIMGNYNILRFYGDDIRLKKK
ncbi:MAG: ATP-binding protein [Clostridia bacterium]|nr:ATP-binding protein [Clostridia bacterium]